MYVVQVTVPLSQEAAWNEWHDKHHLPLVLAQPGFIEVRKFRCMKNAAKEAEYYVLYELRNQAAYNRYVKSEESSRLRQHYLDAFGAKTKITRMTWQETFRMNK
jgi:heme-degrading monooxygenase HmoA